MLVVEPKTRESTDENKRLAKKKKRDRSWKVVAPPGPTIDGHGKGYYLGWGIADWVIAADLWAAAAVFGFAAMGLVAARNDEHARSMEYNRDEAGALAVLSGALSLGTGGIFVAIRAGRNISKFNELRAASRSLSAPSSDVRL